jgi:hypothetical protein
VAAATSDLYLQAAQALANLGYHQGARRLLDLRSSHLVGSDGAGAPPGGASRPALPGLLASLRLGAAALGRAGASAAGGGGWGAALRLASGGGAGFAGGTAGAGAAAVARGAAAIEARAAKEGVAALRWRLAKDLKDLRDTIDLRYGYDLI